MLCKSFFLAPLAAALVAAQAQSGEGLAIGAHAPPLNGGKWVTNDGKMPDMRQKVLLIDFWFAG